MSRWNDTNYPLVTPSGSSRVLVRNATTGAVKSALVSTIGNTESSLHVVASIAALRATAVSGLEDETMFFSEGYYTPGDGGGGQFYYDSSSAGVDNGGTIIAPDSGGGRWIRIYSGPVNAKWFGATGDGTTDDLAFLDEAVAWMDAIGGGQLYLPNGNYYTSDTWVIGNGSNAANSTSGNRVQVIGAGRGAADGLSGSQAAAPTTITYGGATSSTKSVIRLAGPLHSNSVQNIELNCNAKAGIGLEVINVTDFLFQDVVVRKFTAKAYLFTTRTGFVSGAPFGCANGIVLNCFAYDPQVDSCIGIELTSGVASGTTLVANPDSANIDIIGGVYFYGGGANSKGIHFYGADNNTVSGVQLLKQAAGAGNSVYFTQWPGSTTFPHSNIINGLTPSQDVGGTSGTIGNVFNDFSDGEGAAIPTGSYLTTTVQDGRLYVDGQRVYRSRQIISVSSQVTQTNATVTLADLVSQAITIKSSARVRVRCTMTGAKATALSGYAQLKIDAISYGETRNDFGSTGFNSNGSIDWTVNGLAAGVRTVAIQFASGDTNVLSIIRYALTVEELY